MTGLEGLVAGGLAAKIAGSVAGAMIKPAAGKGRDLVFGPKQKRRIDLAVRSAIERSVDRASRSLMQAPARKRAVKALALAPVTDELAERIIQPGGWGGDPPPHRWVADLRGRLEAEGVDPEDLPIDLDRFILELPGLVYEELLVAGNEADSPVADLVSHMLIEEVPRRTTEALVERSTFQRQQDVAKYLAVVKQASDHLPYRAFQYVSQGRRVPPLSAVYMEQQLEELREERSAKEDGPPDAARGIHLSAIQVIERSRNLVIQAGAGQGKSSLLNHLVTSSGHNLQTYPAKVSATGLAAASGGWPRTMATASSNELNHALPLDFFAFPPIPGGLWLVSVDGLDELIDTHKRSELIELLGRLAKDPAGIWRFVVTTRSFTDVRDLVAHGFSRYRLMPPDPEQRSRFISEWFAGFGDAYATREPNFRKWAEQAFTPGLAESPLLLTMAALLEGSTSTVHIRTRPELYDQFVKVLLEDEEAERHTFDLLKQEWTRLDPINGEVTARNLYAHRWDLVEHLAAWRQDNTTASFVDEAFRFVQDSKWIPKQQIADRFRRNVEILLDRTGLISAGKFIHESVREYFAARYWTNSARGSGPNGDALMARWSDPAWQEIVLFGLAIWSREKDVSDLIKPIVDRYTAGFVFAARALAEGVQVSPELEMRILESLLRYVKRKDYFSWFSSDSADEIWQLMPGLGHRPLSLDRLRQIALSTAFGTAWRVRAIEVLGQQHSFDELRRLLHTDPHDPELLLACARQLAHQGHDSETVEVMVRLGNAVHLPSEFRIEVAAELARVGRDSEAVEITLHAARNHGGSWSSESSNQLIQTLTKLRRTDELRRLTLDSQVSPYDRVACAEALCHLDDSDFGRQALIDLSREEPLRFDSRDTRAMAIRALERLGAIEDVVSILMAGLTQHEHAGFDENSAELLADMLRRAQRSDMLGQIASDEGLPLSARIECALQHSGNIEPEVLDRLRTLVRMGWQPYRYSPYRWKSKVSRAVRRLGGADALVAFAEDWQIPFEVRMDCAAELAQAESVADATRLLLQLADHGRADSSVRIDIGKRLAKMGAITEASVMLLRVARDYEPGGMSPSLVVDALTQHGLTEALEELAKDVTLPDRVRITAARALSRKSYRTLSVAYFAGVARTAGPDIWARTEAVEALADLELGDDLANLALDDQVTAQVRAAAGEAAGVLVDSNRALEIAIALLGVGQPELTKAAITVLRRVGQENYLLTRLRNHNVPDWLAEAAIDALREWQRFDELFNLATNQDVNMHVRVLAALELGSIGLSEEVDVILAEATSADTVRPTTRVRALLGLQPKTDVWDELGHLAHDPELDDRTRLRVAKTLLESQYKRVGGAILVSLVSAESDPGVRYQAAEALGEASEVRAFLHATVELVRDAKAPEHIRRDALWLLDRNRWGLQSTGKRALKSIVKDPTVPMELRGFAIHLICKWAELDVVTMLLAIVQDQPSGLTGPALAGLGDLWQSHNQDVRDAIAQVIPDLCKRFRSLDWFWPCPETAS